MRFTKEEVQDILSSCYGDSAKFGKTFFPSRFDRPFDRELHGPIFDLIDNSDNPQKVIAAPRGAGKTSILNLLLPAKKIVYNDSPFIVPISSTNTSAVLQSENLKRELLSNPLIKTIFGDLRSDTFNKELWVVNNAGKECAIMPRGAGQQVRGLLFRDDRPNLILIDDLETKEGVESEEQRAGLKTWFFGDVLNSIDRGKKNWEIIYLGTVLHEDSLLVQLLDDPDWDSVRLSIADYSESDGSFVSNAPNFISNEEILKIYHQFERRGEVDTFFREYFNEATPRGKHAIFQKGYFKYYDDEELNLNNNRYENILIVDVAKTVNSKSADSAIVCYAIDASAQRFYIRDVISGKYHPDELYAHIIAAAQRYRAKRIGVEVTSLHEFVTYPLNSALVKAGVDAELIELHARGGQNEKGKITRIKSLLPFYRTGMIWHNKTATMKLEQQLLSFPNSQLWDVMDAAGYLAEMLELGGRFVDPDAPDPEEEGRIQDELREMREMEEEFGSLDDFRIL